MDRRTLGEIGENMAAEILRTVLVQSMDELYMLGAVILIRALLSLLIHWEIKPHEKKN